MDGLDKVTAVPFLKGGFLCSQGTLSDLMCNFTGTLQVCAVSLIARPARPIG